MGVQLLHCGKSGTRDDPHGLTEETRQRPSSSVLTDCPFLLQGRRNRVGSWTLRVKCGEHNHPSLPVYADAHPLLMSLRVPQVASQYHQRVRNQAPLRELAEPRVFARNARGLDTTFVIAQYLGH